MLVPLDQGKKIFQFRGLMSLVLNGLAYRNLADLDSLSGQESAVEARLWVCVTPAFFVSTT